MAIDPTAKTLRHFRQHYRKTVIVLLAAHVIVLAGVVGLIMQLLGLARLSEPSFWIVIGGSIAVSIAMLYIITPVIIRPLCQILSALAHAIGEPSATPPPNPNLSTYEKTGFKTALQAIYDKHADDTPAEPSNQTFLVQALNRTKCGVAILDHNKHLIFANNAVPVAQQPGGEKFIALDFLNDQNLYQWIDEAGQQSIKSEKTWRRVATNIESIKNTKVYDVIATYEKGAAGETVVFLIDKSENYLPEQEDLNFISFAAHELRGPITVIRGYLDIISDEFADRLRGDESQLMDRLIVSANRLSGYIDNILNVSKFDRHHLQTHLVEERLVDIYATIADDMQLRASTQQRLLNVTIPEDLPTVAADRGSIGEVIGNLIDNAIKYSFEGGVISVNAEQKGDFIEVSVTDNGIGMPPSVVNNLFHKFYRSHRSREAVAGTGIGLYICKAFVESHGGSISARSKENEGSTFSFTLPIYATVKDKLLENGQLNAALIKKGGGWIKNHAMYRN